MGEGEGDRGGENGGGIVEERAERIEEFFFSNAACSSSIFCEICLFDQGYVVYCAFHCGFQIPCCLVFTTTIKKYGSDRLPNIVFVRFCDFCSSAAFTVTHLSLHSLSLHCESKLDPSLYKFCLSFFCSFRGRQGSYQGSGISQASTIATSVPYSQPVGNSSSAMGNAQGPSYNMPPSGKLAKCKQVEVVEIVFIVMNTLEKA